eukprot:g12102.t1 g12102   contig6:1219907-1220903(-)
MSTIKNQDLLALKSYITAADSTQYASLASTTLILDLTHSNLHQRHAEIRFDKHDTVDELRRRIHQKSGTPPCMQHLQLKSAGGGAVFHEILPNMDSDRMLGYYNLPLGANKKNTTNGKGTLRDWGRKQKENDPEFSLKKHAREHAELVEARRLYKESGGVKDGFEIDESTGVIVRCSESETTNANGGDGKEKSESAADIEYGPESIQHLTLTSRCQVQPGSRRGSIAYLGPIPELGAGGHWVGVILDEPMGKTDGTVQASGVRYFEAPGSNRGGFFRGKNVVVGDYPERDIMDELEDSEDEL